MKILSHIILFLLLSVLLSSILIGCENKAEKYRYYIRQTDGAGTHTYWTNEYTLSEGCISFEESEQGYITVCGTFTIQ